LNSLYICYQFRPTRIWNCNETGLSTTVQVPHVIAKKGAKEVQQIMSAETGQKVTLLCFISASRQTIPLVYVFPHVKAAEKMCHPEMVLLDVLVFPRSGWMTTYNFYLSIQHFQKQVNATLEILCYCC